MLLLNLAARFTASPPLEWPINIILLKSTLLYSGERESLLNSLNKINFLESAGPCSHLFL